MIFTWPGIFLTNFTIIDECNLDNWKEFFLFWCNIIFQNNNLCDKSVVQNWWLSFSDDLASMNQLNDGAGPKVVKFSLNIQFTVISKYHKYLLTDNISISKNFNGISQGPADFIAVELGQNLHFHSNK